MPVRNGGQWLIEATHSILSQQGISFELIVINDGSEDGSVDYLRGIGSPELNILHSGGAGLVDALNLGLAVARGRYIARMDADDIALAGRLARQAAVLDAHSEIGLVHSAVQVMDISGRATHLIGAENVTRAHRIAILLGEQRGAPIIHPSVMMRTRLMRSVGGYRHSTAAEDHDLWLRMIDQCGFHAIDEPLLRYRQHETSISRCNASVQILSNLMNAAGYIVRRRFGHDIFSDRPDIHQLVRKNAERLYFAKLASIAEIRSVRWKLRRKPQAGHLIDAISAACKEPRLLFDQNYVAYELMKIRDYIVTDLQTLLLGNDSMKNACSSE